MDKSNDGGFTKEELEKLLPHTKGLNKQLLDADTALKSNVIATKILKKLKWDDLMRILFLLIGGFITFFFTNILGVDKHTETNTEIQKLQTEICVLESGFQKRLNEQHLIILELKNQLEAQKQIQEKQ